MTFGLLSFPLAVGGWVAWCVSSSVKVRDHDLWSVVFSLLPWVCVAWWVSSSVKVMAMTFGSLVRDLCSVVCSSCCG
jgi:hypothetical protein